MLLPAIIIAKAAETDQKMQVFFLLITEFVAFYPLSFSSMAIDAR